MIEFRIPGLPPSTNNLYMTIRGRRVKTAEARKWEKHVQAHMPASLQLKKSSVLAVSMDFHSPRWFYKNGKPRKRDVDNMLKATMDAVFSKMEGQGVNDTQVFSIRGTKRKSESGSEFVVFHLHNLGGL